MKRFVFTCALLVACVIAGPAGHAQSGITPSLAAARNAAERSLRAGRFDEVDTAAAAFPKDEILAVLRAQALIAKGEYAKAEPLLQPFATEKPTGDAALELGLLQLYLGRRGEARRTLQLLLLNESSSGDGARLRAGGAGGARAGPVRGRELAVSRGQRRSRRTTRRSRRAWGDLFLEKHNRQEAAKSFQAALKADPDYAAGAPRAWPGRWRTTTRRPRRSTSSARWSSIPTTPRRTCFSPSSPSTTTRRTRRARRSPRRRRSTPTASRRMRLQAAVDFVEGQDAEYKAAVAAALKINPLYGEAYRVVGSVTARYYRFDEAADQVRRGIAIDRDNARAQADLGVASDAHRRRAQRAPRARDRRSAPIRSTSSPTTCSACSTSSRGFRRFATAICIIKLHADEVGGHARVRAGRSRRRRWPRSASAGTSRRRGRFSSRCSRSTTTSPCARRPARDDRRARRLLRARRHHGLAEGAAAGRVQLGRDALARDGARHHAAAVESAHPAVAHRRHLGLRGEARARRSGAARWSCRSRGRWRRAKSSSCAI